MSIYNSRDISLPSCCIPCCQLATDIKSLIKINSTFYIAFQTTLTLSSPPSPASPSWVPVFEERTSWPQREQNISNMWSLSLSLSTTSAQARAHTHTNICRHALTYTSADMRAQMNTHARKHRQYEERKTNR